MARIRNDYTGSRWENFRRWLQNGDDALDRVLEDAVESAPPQAPVQAGSAAHDGRKTFRTGKPPLTALERVLSVLFCLGVIAVMLITTADLPPFGSADAPPNNEVPQRYIEQGLQETGAVNVVAGMILDYRAFDTLGESNVFFVAACAVMILLRVSKGDRRAPGAPEERLQPDTILQTVTLFLVPLLLVFGSYVILNGHLSPGGGFSGGTLMGAALILYMTAFGHADTARFFTFRTFQAVSASALVFYAGSKAYSFFTGANHLPSVITPGTPGAIFSAGLIPYLNLAVGLVVCCTMYAFYTLFRRGDI